MDHLQYMCVRSNQDPEQPPSGHALMISCPPYSHIEKHPEVPYPHKTMDIPNSELMKLFQLSQNLPLDAEITPVIALKMIYDHERFNELTLQDFQAIREDLKMKTRCYGYASLILVSLVNHYSLLRSSLKPVYACDTSHCRGLR